MLPGGLVRRVVRHLVLEEDRLAVLAVPDDVVLLVVLDEQAGGGDVVAVDDDAGVGGVRSSSRRRCRGRRARPRCRRGSTLSLLTTRLVVALPTCGAADPEEHVVERGRVGRVAAAVVSRVPSSPSGLPTCSSTGEFTGPASKMSPAIFDALDVGDRHRDDAVLRGRASRCRGRARPCPAASP